PPTLALVPLPRHRRVPRRAPVRPPRSPPVPALVPRPSSRPDPAQVPLPPGSSSGSTGSTTDNSSAATSLSTVLATAPPPASSSGEQSSLTLDASVIQTTDDGQNPLVTGQSAAATSTNDFMNFCAGQTNGLQITTVSCNPTYRKHSFCE
ncbi:hypothetical protein K438DRAFT_2077650, partial [Mycena galopus ATCC 62051]